MKRNFFSKKHIYFLIPVVLFIFGFIKAEKVFLNEHPDSGLIWQLENEKRVLFIGNSYIYFNDMPKVLKKLSMSAGSTVKIETEEVTNGGFTLEKHWKSGKALKAIKNGNWDYVILQEQSTRPLTDPGIMFEFARKFHSEIKMAGAETIFLMTWARKNKPSMINGLKDAYESIGDELNACVAPAGPAWRKCGRQYPEIELFKPDGSHPNSKGTYLTACILYSVITGNSPEGMSDGGLKRIRMKDTLLLQNLAWDIVKNYRAKVAN